jgi:hypothetical protein
MGSFSLSLEPRSSPYTIEASLTGYSLSQRHVLVDGPGIQINLELSPTLAPGMAYSVSLGSDLGERTGCAVLTLYECLCHYSAFIFYMAFWRLE